MRPFKKNTEIPQQSLPTQFVNFIFFKLDNEWRKLPSEAKVNARKEFEEILTNQQDKPGVFLLPYTLLGLKADADLMLWRISDNLEILQEMTSELLNTTLGKYLNTNYSYVSITKRSVYVDKMDPEHQNSRTHIIPGKSKYLFVYPFVKTRDWYQLSMPARQGMMDEHIQVGSRYPSVKINTTYSFGIDSTEFVVAFESDSPKDFVNLVQELRETEASRYTLTDTPMFTCIHQTSVSEAIRILS